MKPIGKVIFTFYAIFAATAVAGLIMFIFGLIGENPEIEKIGGLLALCSVAIVLILYLLAMLGAMAAPKASREFFNDADPYKYLEKLLKIQNGKRYFAVNQQTLKIFISAAYSFMGKFDESLAVIGQVKLPKNKLLELTVYSIYIDYFSSKGDINATLMWYQTLIDFANKKQFHGVFTQAVNDCVLLSRAGIGLLQNDLNAFDWAVINCLNKRDNRVQATANDYVFARYAIARGEIQNAMFYLNAVIANGNRLFVVDEAKRLLEKITSEGRV